MFSLIRMFVEIFTKGFGKVARGGKRRPRSGRRNPWRMIITTIVFAIIAIIDYYFQGLSFNFWFLISLIILNILIFMSYVVIYLIAKPKNQEPEAEVIIN